MKESVNFWTGLQDNERENGREVFPDCGEGTMSHALKIISPLLRWQRVLIYDPDNSGEYYDFPSFGTFNYEEQSNFNGIKDRRIHSIIPVTVQNPRPSAEIDQIVEECDIPIIGEHGETPALLVILTKE